MKILIITQVIDSSHPILGFFHRWVEEFAKHCEQVHVICLEVGRHSLPANVTVHSLGKESGKGRVIYLWRFYKYIWSLRKEYDNVFVHMNQIYVVLGAPFWHALGKKVSLWYMHGSVSQSLRIAEKLVDKIFTGSSDSFRLRSSKVVVTGHGIDTVRFAPQTVPKDLDLITVGRITESKNLTALIDVLELVRNVHDVTLTIVGEPVTTEERAYQAKLEEYIHEKALSSVVVFAGRVSQSELPTTLNRAKIFVTTAQNGSLDKAVLEAMACGLPVVSMAIGTISLPLKNAQTSTLTGFVTELQKVLESRVYMNQSHVNYVTTNHSLHALIPKILSAYDK
jgi:glycosyltransferase involved in cell wall biosynthesis